MNYSRENCFGLTENKSLPHIQTEKKKTQKQDLPCHISLANRLLGLCFYNCFIPLKCFENATENVFSSERVLFSVSIKKTAFF